MRCLIWICTVCVRPIKRTLGLCGLKQCRPRIDEMPQKLRIHHLIREEIFWDKDIVNTAGRWQSKTPILWRNLDQKLIKSVFDHHLSPHWPQMVDKNTVSIDFDPSLSIVDRFFDCRLPGVVKFLIAAYPVWSS